MTELKPVPTAAVRLTDPLMFELHQEANYGSDFADTWVHVVCCHAFATCEQNYCFWFAVTLLSTVGGDTVKVELFPSDVLLIVGQAWLSIRFQDVVHTQEAQTFMSRCKSARVHAHLNKARSLSCHPIPTHGCTRLCTLKWHTFLDRSLGRSIA